MPGASLSRDIVLHRSAIHPRFEQYYFTLVEYGRGFRPHFVVVSVCPNDFGDEFEVVKGAGDDWDACSTGTTRISRARARRASL